MRPLFSVCGAVQISRLSRRPPPHNTGVRKKKRRGGHSMEICWELYSTKCSNVILSPRISTHASKVHTPPFLSVSFSKHSCRCGLVSMVTICITQPGPRDFSFRFGWRTAPTGNVLPHARGAMNCVTQGENKKHCTVCVCVCSTRRWRMCVWIKCVWVDYSYYSWPM